MFERIKCYRNLKKTDKFIRGVRRIGELTQNEEIIQNANIAAYNNAVIKKKMWFNRKLAENYNLELIKSGWFK